MDECSIAAMVEVYVFETGGRGTLVKKWRQCIALSRRNPAWLWGLRRGKCMADNQVGAFSRRGFLRGAAAVSLGTAATASGVTTGVTPAVADGLPPTPPHGAELRGMDLVTQSPTTEGRFGFMFKNQPPLPASEALLDRLGATMEEQPVVSTTVTKDDNDSYNENPNPRLTSGFTFVGQFVDHDITFDTTTLDQQQSDPCLLYTSPSPRDRS